MGNLLVNFKRNLIESFMEMVDSGAYILYGFGAQSIGWPNDIPEPNETIYQNEITPKIQLMFGKKITPTDIIPIIKHIPWEYGKVYQEYDVNLPNLYATNFYAVCQPDVVGGYYHVFKCIENNNGEPSIYKPDQYITSVFTKADGYSWKYMFSVSDANFKKFGNIDFIPVTENASVKSASYDSSGIDRIKIDIPGDGYITYHEGLVRSVSNTTVLQIDPGAVKTNDFYNKSSIYVYNVGSQTGQLKLIDDYTSNSSGNWVKLASAVNNSIIYSGLTKYIISPTVRIIGDGDRQALAYSLVSNNKISQIKIIDRGAGYTTAQAEISCNTSFGSGASLLTTVPLGTGHGYDAAAELNVKGLSINFSFANTESGMIPVGHSYSCYGIISNPRDAANTTYFYAGNTFNQILEAAPLNHHVFANNEIVVGQTTGSLGYVLVSNSSHLYLTGAKTFANNETIIGKSSEVTDKIVINNRGNIYYKDSDVLYVRNIPKVDRSESQSETFKLFIEV